MEYNKANPERRRKNGFYHRSQNEKQLRCFVDYPNQLYRDVEQFVPATYGDDLEDWDRSKNPAFAYCDARCWLAYRDGEVVGASAPFSAARPTKNGAPTDCALRRWILSTIRRCRARSSPRSKTGRVRSAAPAVHGPLGFTDMDREGMLIDGFDRRGCFFTYYNFPYYKEHMAALGYVKDVDWIENLISVPTDERIFQRWEKIANYVLRHHHLHVYEVHNRLGYLPLLKRFFKLVNIAYAPLYGTVELSEEQIRKYSMKFAPLINPKLTCFVMDENNELVAFGVAAPSIAEALKKSRGRIFPTGWAGLLHAFRVNDTLDLLLIAVRPDLQKKGVNAVIINKVMKASVKMGIKHAETGPMLETNEAIQSQWYDFPVEQHKRRRCWIKELQPAQTAGEPAPVGVGSAEE